MHAPSTPPSTPPTAASSSRFSPSLKLNSRPSPSSPPRTIDHQHPGDMEKGLMMDEDASAVASSSADPEGGRKTPEKKRSIDVPGIVLTEPEHLPPYPSRIPSPPPKSILLLSPCQVEIDPTSSSTKIERSSYSYLSSSSSRRPYSPAFAALLQGRQSSGTGRMRLTVVLLLLAICAWHLYAYAHLGLSLGLSTEDDFADGALSSSIGADGAGYTSGASTL